MRAIYHNATNAKECKRLVSESAPRALRAQSEVEDWLALRHAPQLTPRAINSLLEHFGNARAIRDASQSELASFNVSATTRRFLARPVSAKYDKDLRWLDDPLNHIIPKSADEYPEQLKNLAGAPIMLFVRGDVSLLSDPQIAIVGARKPTPLGAEYTREFAAAFARKGLVVTSGFAQGVDAYAHRTAVAVNTPTIAVLGTGVDVCYPRKHRGLAEEIVQNGTLGALVSEFSVGTPPRGENFPQRNRIISGLSLGVLVVEAGYKSGALITARHAAEYGRDVFAIPGSIRNPMAQGCHKLIQQGAKLVQSPDDVFAEIAGHIQLDLSEALPEDLELDKESGKEFDKHGGHDGKSDNKLDKKQSKLLELVGYDPVMIDTIVERSQLPVTEVIPVMLILEMKGYIASDNGFYTRIK